MPTAIIIVLLLIRCVSRCVCDLATLFQSVATNSTRLTSLYEFNTSSPLANTLAGVPDAVLNDAVPVPGVDKSDKGQIFVRKPGHIDVSPKISAVAPHSKVNNYTILLDVKFSNMGKFTSLYQFTLTNDDDGDAWLRKTDTVYIGVGVHSYIGTDVSNDNYFRYVITADLEQRQVRYYVNGRLVNDASDARCGSCFVDGKFSFGSRIWLVTDNDGEEAPAHVTTAAFWSAALSPDAVKSLGPPAFGADDAPACAAMDELGGYLMRGLPPIVGGGTTGVTKCGQTCCRAEHGNSARPCYALDARFKVNHTTNTCDLNENKEVCSSVVTHNVPNKQQHFYGYFCTPHADNSRMRPPMEPLIAYVGGTEPESHIPAAVAFYTAIRAFLKGFVVNKSAIHSSLSRIAKASFAAQTAKGLLAPYALSQQATYELVYGNQTAVRAASGTTLSIDPRTGSHFKVADATALSPLFRAGRTIPLPLAVVAGSGVEYCEALSQSVGLGAHTMMVSASCSFTTVKQKVRTVHGGPSAICRKWTRLFTALNIHKFGLVWSRDPMSSFYYERFRTLILSTCMTRCQNNLQGNTPGLCLSVDVEVCVETSPSVSCLSPTEALRKLEAASVRVIVAGLDSQASDFSTFTKKAINMGMTGQSYLWLFMADTTAAVTSPKMSFLQIQNFGTHFDGSLLLVSSCDGPKWQGFQAILNNLTAQDFPQGLFDSGMTFAGGTTYGVMFDATQNYSRYMWYFKDTIDPKIALVADATWTVLLAMNRLATRHGHAPYALPPEALIAEIDRMKFDGVCSDENGIHWGGDGRATATPLRVYNVRKTVQTFENKRNPGTFYNFVADKLAKVTDNNITWFAQPRYFGNRTSPPSHVPPDCPKGHHAKHDMLCHPCPIGRYSPVSGRGNICNNCSAGQVTYAVGQSQCVGCPVGKWSDGQSNSSDGSVQCSDCSPGKYTRDPGRSDCSHCFPQGGVQFYASQSGMSECLSCPQGANCPPNSQGLHTHYEAKYGWYSITGETMSTSRLFKCISFEDEDSSRSSCVGRNLCVDSMEGPFCGTCRYNYVAQSARGICRVCKDEVSKIMLIAIAVGIVLVTIAVQLFSFFSRDVSQPLDVSSVILKLVMNYSHMLSVVLQYVSFSSTGTSTAAAFEWSEVIVALPSEVKASLACLYLGGKDLSAQYRNVVQAYLELPFVITCSWIGFFLHAGFRKLLYKQKPDWQRTVPILIITLWVMQARLIQPFVNTFRCVVFDVPRLIGDLSVECNSKNHEKWEFISWAGIATFALGIPCLFFYLLHRVRDRLRKHSTKRLYGFLYMGFEPKYYYFECVYMLRRVLFELAATTPYAHELSESESMTGLLILLSVSGFFLACHDYFQPFDNRAEELLDKVENDSLIAITVTLLTKCLTTAANETHAFQSPSSRKMRDFVAVVIVLAFHVRFYWRVSFGLLRPLWRDCKTRLLSSRSRLSRTLIFLGLRAPSTFTLDAHSVDLQKLTEMSRLQFFETVGNALDDVSGDELQVLDLRRILALCCTESRLFREENARNSFKSSFTQKLSSSGQSPFLSFFDAVHSACLGNYCVPTLEQVERRENIQASLGEQFTIDELQASAMRLTDCLSSSQTWRSNVDAALVGLSASSQTTDVDPQKIGRAQEYEQALTGFVTVVPSEHEECTDMLVQDLPDVSSEISSLRQRVVQLEHVETEIELLKAQVSILIGSRKPCLFSL